MPIPLMPVVCIPVSMRRIGCVEGCAACCAVCAATSVAAPASATSDTTTIRRILMRFLTDIFLSPTLLPYVATLVKPLHLLQATASGQCAANVSTIPQDGNLFLDSDATG